jgi:hypothetical protein
MLFILSHRWGADERSSDPARLDELLAELDTHPEDREHTSVSASLPSGWTVNAYCDGLVIYENVEELTVAPRHMRVKTRSEAKALMSLLVQEEVEELERQPWHPGNGW